MTDFVLVRHGETVWHAENRFAGRSDVSLNRHGFDQADALGVWAVGRRIDAVFHSPLARARCTAAPAVRALGLRARVDDRLAEVAFGRAEGLTMAEMQERFPERLAAFLRDPVAHHLPGGEDPRAAARRAHDALRDIAEEFPGGRVLVVAHSALFRLLLCRLLGIPLAEYRRVLPRIDNATLTEVRLSRDRAALLRYNAPIRQRAAAKTRPRLLEGKLS